MEDIYNIALLPIDDSFNQKLIHYSQVIDINAPYKLGKDSLPHITLLQFQMDDSDLEILKSNFQRLEVFNISTLGFSFARFKHLDSWAVDILKSSELVSLQKKLKEQCNILPINGFADSFSPHFTMAAWESQNNLPIKFDIEENIIYQDNIKCRLSLGISGPNFQFAKEIL